MADEQLDWAHVKTASIKRCKNAAHITPSFNKTTKPTKHGNTQHSKPQPSKSSTHQTRQNTRQKPKAREQS
jgi:hypothetical protein